MAAAARERQAAVLLITQEPGILANYCDRVLTMEHGRIVADRSVAEHFSRSGETTHAIPVADGGPAVLEAQALTKTFPLRNSRAVVHAVDNVDLTASEGETVGLVGESGSGKTTVGRLLLRLTRPDSGTVRIVGQDVAELGPGSLRALRRRVQLVRQDPFDSFDPRWSVLRSVSEPLVTHGFANPEARARELLGLVGCGAIAEERPRDCSAGDLQRAAVVRALATEPAFVVLDEPTSVLAPPARRDLTALLARLQRETRAAFLFISHDLTTVAAISHRVAVMYLGQIVETGPTSEIFHAPRHPYTRALIAAHLSVDPARRRVDNPPLERLDGEIPSPVDLPPGCYLASRCAYVRPRCIAERQSLLADGAGEVRCWRAVAGELPPFVRQAA
ncbi:oligopeptide/dipeptide ABC transporter ATP-binding protein [Novosphingobium sp. Gsoil 351]|uniref:oligopeptide/dipeptide ABC transporter ATP-binding protein n=1 Tax=Novosphingobium sp. Gsoil 351 TaxID=2675225 RepID=UPI0018A842C5|nr:oligopeptide/dipeptide ABC transporter ATP-binding protein [Novosphingobium sp. Gsoil 351]